jgi:hypothetical protein
MEYPYTCQVDIAFDSSVQAEQVMKIMSVDREIGERVAKTFNVDSASSTLTV